MEIGGVIIPSASRAAPPSIAGITSHFLLLRTSANKEKIPPSPLLSARKTSHTYLIVVMMVMVHKISDKVPSMSSSVIVLSLMMELKTYKGEVPISP